MDTNIERDIHYFKNRISKKIDVFLGVFFIFVIYKVCLNMLVNDDISSLYAAIDSYVLNPLFLISLAVIFYMALKDKRALDLLKEEKIKLDDAEEINDRLTKEFDYVVNERDGIKEYDITVRHLRGNGYTHKRFINNYVIRISENVSLSYISTNPRNGEIEDRDFEVIPFNGIDKVTSEVESRAQRNGHDEYVFRLKFWHKNPVATDSRESMYINWSSGFLCNKNHPLEINQVVCDIQKDIQKAMNRANSI